MKKTTVFLVVLVFVAAIAIAFFYFQPPRQSDDFSLKDGRISYPSNRPLPDYNATVLEDNSEYSLTKISFQNRDTTVYALLRIPKSTENPSVAIILPGSTVPKEARQNVALLLQKEGVASLALDERGNGETKLASTNLQLEFLKFTQGTEFLDVKMTLDALKAYDVLKAFPVNRGKTFLIGESMGGRFAILAAAIDPSVAGVLVISSAGYGLPSGNTDLETQYLRAIDPDNYVSLISPRPVFFIHSTTDAVIPVASAEKTFSIAGQPKNFSTVECSHGYCPQMDDAIVAFFKKFA